MDVAIWGHWRLKTRPNVQSDRGLVTSTATRRLRIYRAVCATGRRLYFRNRKMPRPAMGSSP
jgi:hypothetical protein